MTALDELRCGEIGNDFVALLQRTIRAVAVARNFPAPDGHDRWNTDAVTTALGDFLASAQTPRRLTDLATHCRTEDALKRRLQETVRNYFADNGRRTPVGRLVLRINEVLAAEPDFERRGRYWSLKGSSADPPPVDIDALVAATAGVNVVVPTAWTGDRQGPDTDAHSVVRLAHAALTAAGGPLRTADIAQAVARRVGLGGAPLSIEATAFDPPSPSSVSADATGDEALSKMRAREIFFGRLNDAERVSIGLPDFPVAKLGPVLGVSGSTAALIRKRAVAILQSDLREEEGGQAVADAVLDLARSWTERWMN
jgi:hypothetical protein